MITVMHRHCTTRAGVLHVLILLGSLSFGDAPCLAQSSKLSVAILHTGEDPAGERLAYEIREAIRRSAAYELAPLEKSTLQVQLVTIDTQDKGSRLYGNATAAATAFTVSNFIPYEAHNPQTWLPIFLTATIQTCGIRALEDCAKSTLAVLDKEVEHYKSKLVK
jgi:hypothetical protein